MNLKKSSTLFSEKPAIAIPNWIGYSFAVFSFAGFVDAAYLSVKYYLGSKVGCALLGGCEIVTSSKFADVAGVPIALPGAAYYLLVFLISIYYLDSANKNALIAAGLLSTAGFLISLVLLYIQIFALGALCLYCLASLATSTLLFINSLFLLRS